MNRLLPLSGSYMHAADAYPLAATAAVANRTLSFMGMNPTSAVIELHSSTSAA
jgi:hypothetical protein